MSDNNPKARLAASQGKTPMELLPYRALASVARVLDLGRKKYGLRNWREEPISASTYIGAIARHALLEWAEGKDTDDESGEHPLAHVAACCLLVMDAEQQGTFADDRGESEVLLREEPLKSASGSGPDTTAPQKFQILSPAAMGLAWDLHLVTFNALYNFTADAWRVAENGYQFYITDRDISEGYVKCLSSTSKQTDSSTT
ncbi:MAG: dATP/dGTP diphosphohydrolase domain-containing protein [Planctomycetota bacterium]